MEIRVPKQTTTFVFDDGRSHEVSLLSAFEAVQEIGTKRKGEESFDYANDFRAWWKANARSNQGVAEISRDEAYFLWDAVPIQLHLEKKTQREPLISLTSTALTPSDSAQSN